jgi:cytochrome P450
VRRHEHSDGKPKELGEETIFDRLLAGNNSKENEADMSRRKQAPKMAAQQIADESVGLLMAGTETTATMLAYGTYYFMTFPEVQAKIMAELATVQRTESGRLPIQQIESLPYFVS